MRNRFWIPTAALALCVGPALAQTLSPGYEIARWHDFRPAAISHTFDDNLPNQLAIAVPLFDEFGLKLTLFALTDNASSWARPNWPGMQAAAANGHEIASHTVTHVRLPDVTMDQQRTELRASADSIAARIPEQQGLTLAYPFCVVGDNAMTAEYYIAARGCQGAIERATPADMLNISSIVVGSQGSVQNAAQLNARSDAAVSSGGWAVFLTHGIDNDGGYSPIPSAELRAHVEYLAENQDRFWVETFGNVVRYIRERDAASVVEESADENRLVVQVTDDLDDTIYDHPITLRRALPEGWANVTVTQDGEPVRQRLLDEDGARYVIFDATPDAGDVAIDKADNTGLGDRDGVRPEQPARIG
ncbi:MAG TPA: polysaccharide deacetylase family protein, partial [Rhodothermales bacterium]